MIPRVPEIPPLVPPGARFAFGKSPFHVKGVLFQGTQAFFEQNVQGGVATLASEITQPELREFIQGNFLTAGWYDVMPVPALIAYEARALRMGLAEYLLHRTRYQAKRDLGGVYGWVLRIATPSMVVTRLPRVMSQMFDFATTEVVRETDHEVEMRFAGIPAVLEQWLHTAIVVYAETALKLAGARSVETSPPRVESAKDVDGVRVVTLSCRVTWA